MNIKIKKGITALFITLGIFAGGYFSTNKTYAQTGSNCVVTFFAANPGILEHTGTTTLTWGTNGCTSVVISNIGAVPLSGNIGTGTLIDTTTFTLTATGADGTQKIQTLTVRMTSQNVGTCKIISFNASPSIVAAYDNTALNWQTSGCDKITLLYGNSVVDNLPGTISGFQTGSIVTTTIFTLKGQDGSNTSVTKTTSVGVTQAPGGSLTACNDGIDNDGDGRIDFDDSGCTSLSDNSEYNYIQTVGQTLPPTTNAPALIARSNSGEAVGLAVENKTNNFCQGQYLDQTISYRNNSTTAFNNVILRITIPKHIQFTRTSTGTYSESDNTITVSVGTLLPGQTGIIYISGIIREVPVIGSQDLSVTNAVIAYNNPITLSQENTTAYGLIDSQACKTNNLVGLALFGVDFFPTTLTGLFFIIFLVLAIIFLSRHLYPKKETPYQASHH